MGGLASQIRLKVLEMAHKAGRGHVGGSLSAVEILLALYGGVLRPQDRLIVSKGHISEVVYAVLAHFGYIPEEELDTFGQNGSRLGDHLSHHVPGVEVSGGSLGHGLGIACGMALADRLDGQDRLTYCLLGDGEMLEGSVWEAVQFAGYMKLGNLVAIVDANGLMTLEKPPVEPLWPKFEAFGWTAGRCDGNNISLVKWWLRSLKGRRYLYEPKVLIASTVKGKGVSVMEGDPRWHHVVPNEAEMALARQELA